MTSSKFKTVFLCIKLNKIIHLLATFLPALHSSDKHNCHQTRSATQNLQDVALVRTNKYSKKSVKYQPMHQRLEELQKEVPTNHQETNCLI